MKLSRKPGAPDMFDLEQNLHQWRQELEATLAFSTEEIDELEDHLRLSLEARQKDGTAPEVAWAQSLGNLGPASKLALEFAKDKLMPALWRLLASWWSPACLMVIFGFIFFHDPSTDNQMVDPEGAHPILAYRAPFFWIIIITGFLLTLTLIPKREYKNALLAGIGSALCLLPQLNLLFYNSLAEHFIGPGWTHMATSFGWSSISLGLIGIIIINFWWWKRSGSIGSRRSEITVIALLVLLFAISPVTGELIGNLSIREVYHMPSPADVNYTGETRNDFLKWKFVDVLLRSLIFVLNVLPFALILLLCAGTLALQIRAKKIPAKEVIFPSAASLPWIMTLVGSGLCWIVGHFVEAPLSEQIRMVQREDNHIFTVYGGVELSVLFSAAIFFITGWELTKKLKRASQIRSFYAWVIVTILLLVTLALAVFDIVNAFSNPSSASSQPRWLSWMLGLAILSMALYQSLLIVRKQRTHAGPISLWKYEGKNLIEMGLLLGLVYATSWLILTMVAIVMAYVSVTVISAMIAWGNWVKDPAHSSFNPQIYGIPDHLSFWIACTFSYLAFSLAAGLGTVIILSAFEFIRFNAYRLYRVRKVRQELNSLALNT